KRLGDPPVKLDRTLAWIARHCHLTELPAAQGDALGMALGLASAALDQFQPFGQTVGPGAEAPPGHQRRLDRETVRRDYPGADRGPDQCAAVGRSCRHWPPPAALSRCALSFSISAFSRALMPSSRSPRMRTRMRAAISRRAVLASIASIWASLSSGGMPSSLA